ncbi:arsenate reductase ArsC [Rubrivivax gelatinosus]|uniref:Putative tyrosine phosphatase n=1 Tax=Rubrivivax gelatinosus (strain NBRC 100245 / IL144) TaxID=983917 RepID=I0HQY3_RUBGI|nr:arsenate reductase ArsC [Rubrivivax gelatinosus]BAL95420.1 putative tyrosine phosphatase [Rubrivivax gelatinosus IL144]
MEPTTYNVLFVCTGNSARSVLAEALMNRLGEGRFRAFSAGSHPKGELHPLTLKTLAAQGLPTDGLRSKSWEEFALPGAPELHFVFTVCDQAAGEVCPVWPGQPVTAHWGMPDPAAAPAAQGEQAFVDTFVTMKRRIQLMLALPLASLDRVALKTRVTDIGKD